MEPHEGNVIKKTEEECHLNRLRSIYQYSNMASRLSGQTSIFAVGFLVSKTLFGTDGTKETRKLKTLQF